MNKWLDEESNWNKFWEESLMEAKETNKSEIYIFAKKIAHKTVILYDEEYRQWLIEYWAERARKRYDKT